MVDAIKSLVNPTPEGDWFSSGVSEAGDGDGDGGGGSQCTDKCFNHGNCDEVRGECMCVGTYVGPTCEDLAMPACHLAGGYVIPCYLMSTCGCRKECDRYQFSGVLGRECWDERREGGGVETNFSKIVGGPQIRLALGGEEFPMSQASYVNDFMDPDSCPLQCSKRGLCVKRDKTCL